MLLIIHNIHQRPSSRLFLTVVAFALFLIGCASSHPGIVAVQSIAPCDTCSFPVVAGWVVDSDTNQPISQANVDVIETGFGAGSDSSGYFVFQLPPGEYTFRVRAIAHQSTRSDPIQVAPKQWLNFQIVMKPSHVVPKEMRFETY
jgi:hypothetical protein